MKKRGRRIRTGSRQSRRENLTPSTSSGPLKNKEQIKQEAQDFIEELEYLYDTNTTLSSFLSDYRIFYNQFLTSYENVERMEKKKDDLRKDILILCKLIKNDLTTGEVELQNIEILKKEIARRKKNNKFISGQMGLLKDNILELSKNCQRLQKFSKDEIKNKKSLYDKEISQAKDELFNRVMLKKEELYEKVNQLRVDDMKNQKESTVKIATLEKERMNLNQMKSNYSSLVYDIDTEKGRMEIKKKELERKKEEHQKLIVTINASRKELKRNSQELSELRNEESTKRQILKLKETEYLNQVEREKECTLKRDRIITNNAKLDTEKLQIGDVIGEFEKKIIQLSRKTNKCNNKIIMISKVIRKLDSTKRDKQKRKKKLNLECEFLKEEIHDLKLDCEKQKLKTEDIDHQNNILCKKLNGEDKEEEKRNSIITILLTKKRNIMQSINHYRQRSENDRRTIYRLKEEKKNCKKVINEIEMNSCELRKRESEISLQNEEYGKMIEKESENLKKQIELYDEVENDRGNIFKKMSKVEMITRIQTKRMFILNTTIKQVKNEIRQRDKELTKLNLEKDKIEDELETLGDTQSGLSKSIKNKKKEITERIKSIGELNQIITKSLESKRKQNREVNLLANERDLLGNRLLQKNEELFDLYKDMKIKQEKINCGKLEFEKKVEEISILKARIESIQKRNLEIKEIMNLETSLKMEVNSLRKQMVKEKMKFTVLLEEGNVNLNVHQYRTLENTNPTIFKHIKKLSSLKKELIERNKKLFQVELLIKEKEILYKQIKKNLENKDIVSQKENIENYENTIKKKNNQIWRTENELKETRLLLKSIEHEKRDINNQLNVLQLKFKKKYF